MFLNKDIKPDSLETFRIILGQGLSHLIIADHVLTKSIGFAILFTHTPLALPAKIHRSPRIADKQQDSQIQSTKKKNIYRAIQKGKASVLK